MSTNGQHHPAPKRFIDEAESMAHRYDAIVQRIADIRKRALELFSSEGIPNTRHEEWKYLDLSALATTPFRTATPDDAQRLNKADADRLRLIGNDECLILVENGSLNRSASDLNTLPAGIRVGTLADLGTEPEVMDHLFSLAEVKGEPLVALNTMLSYDPLIVLIEKHAQVTKPIHVAFVGVPESQPLNIAARLLIVAGEHASCTIAESYRTFGEGSSTLTNAVTETQLGPSARLHHIKLQSEAVNAQHISYHKVHLTADSYQHLTTLTLGGVLVRNTLNIRLDGQHINTYLNGLYVVDGHMVVDNHTLVDHAMPNCFSSELYKGIIAGRGQGVFNGKIWVRPDAQKTNAYQSNKNILLSDEASMNTKPQLEIYADDVKCSHGATTGQLMKRACSTSVRVASERM
jgi:Fe-S cluster assembly protein SufD